MARHIVTVNQLRYGFSPDDLQPLLNRPWPVMTARLIDEITGESPASSAIHPSTPVRGLIPRIADGGLLGLVGIPAQVFPALANRSYEIPLTLNVSGYVTRQETVVIGPTTHRPNENFKSVDLGNVLLHVQPILIGGRTVQADGNGKPQPVAGARITITGIWRTVPPADQHAPAESPNLVSLSPSLYVNCAAGSGKMQNCKLIPAAGDDKALLDDAPVGARVIRLSNQQNLAIGDLLSFDSDSPDNGECLVIAALEQSGNQSSPARVTLAYPLGLAHRKDAVVRKVNPQGAGPQKQFIIGALPGDNCIFLDDVAGLTDQVCISREVNPSTYPTYPTYHRIALFSAISDNDGYYRMPPLSRVAQLELSAEKGGLKAEKRLRPDYTVRENRVDFLLS